MMTNRTTEHTCGMIKAVSRTVCLALIATLSWMFLSCDHGVQPCRERVRNPLSYGLWGVLRADLHVVFDAGFRGVRPPHGPDPDNYFSASSYAAEADAQGFTMLIYDSGLQYFYEGLRYYRMTGTRHPDYPAADTTLEWIMRESEFHFDAMNQPRYRIQCHPYLDEPEGIGEFGAKIVGGVILWEDYPAGHPGSDAWEYDVVREFAGLIRHLRSYAERRGRKLLIATTTPEIGHECDFVHVECSRIPSASLRRHPSYYYNTNGSELMSSYYETIGFMSKGLAAIQSNYGLPVGEIINFFDSRYGCRSGCTQRDIFDHVAVNRKYSAWNWFFQGDYLSTDYTPVGTNVLSTTQWSMLVAALKALRKD
jgi:hypothetical protein